MKKIIPLLLLCFAAALDSSAQTPGIVTGNQVCIRRAPNESTILKGEKYHHYNKGEKVDVYGTVGDYYLIKYRGTDCYLPKKYVELTTTQNSSTTGCPPRVIVAGDNVCLRSQPDEAHKMTGADKPHLFTGEIYDCVGETEDYYHIVYNGSYYYLPKKYGRPRY